MLSTYKRQFSPTLAYILMRLKNQIKHFVQNFECIRYSTPTPSSSHWHWSPFNKFTCIYAFLSLPLHSLVAFFSEYTIAYGILCLVRTHNIKAVQFYSTRSGVGRWIYINMPHHHDVFFFHSFTFLKCMHVLFCKGVRRAQSLQFCIVHTVRAQQTENLNECSEFQVSVKLDS